jgi:hypothetical protein
LRQSNVSAWQSWADPSDLLCPDAKYRGSIPCSSAFSARDKTKHGDTAVKASAGRIDA